MKRKLVKQGASTMMISLPTKWIKENKLDKGDEINLEEEQSKIVISLDMKSQIKNAEISLSSINESAVRTILTNLYRDGYDKLKINVNNEKIIEVIEKKVLTQLLGLELIKKTSQFCILENVTEPSKEQFRNIFSKMIINIDELLNLTKNALTGENFKDFYLVEEKIKQYDNFCRRIIAKEELDREDLRLSFHQELIHAQRNIYYLLIFLSKHKIKADKNEMSMLDNCKAMFNLLKDAESKKDIRIIEKMHELETEVYAKGYEIIKKSDPVVIHHLLNATRGFYLAASPLVCLEVKPVDPTD